MATAITLLVLCLPAITVCYIAWCLASPWGTCRRCRPGGRNRVCRACEGTGMRPRLGWQVYLYLRRLHRGGTH
ncbi:hypothetical protein DP939_23310 [Spongiactinospora rosea]|uniref:Uncharacterized protein n=1 Tax=Spongiactinospora rosea TaxID=2248750 RepID=A0A366LX74_9ACTN|nr:hypothetical protein DP939_23310 [Spongiactinospora rosea]